jgi:hypothetical protein
LKIRRRRSLIVAQGCFNPGFRDKTDPTLKAFANAIWPTLSALNSFLSWGSRVVASSNPGLNLANAFGVRQTEPAPLRKGR